MRRRLQFSLRTLLLAVAALGVMMAFGPKLFSYCLWRYRVHRAVESVLDQGPDLYWSFDFRRSRRSDDYLLLLSDSDRVLAVLIHAVETDAAEPRAINALKTMRDLLARSGSAQLRTRCLRQLITVLISRALTQAVEEELVATVADWIPSTGINFEERRELLARAKTKSPGLTPAWAKLLIAVGGREELLLVLQFGGDEKLMWDIHNSALIRCHWRGLLPYVKEWLKDPIVARTRLLDYSILRHTAAGRSILLDYAADGSHAVELRRRAVERLQQSLAGVEVLLNAAEDPQAARAFAEVTEADSVRAIEAAQFRLQQRNADELWSELIQGLEPSYWISGSAGSPEADKSLEMAGQHDADVSLKCLQLLAGRSDYTTQNEWRAWHSQHSPGAVTQRRLVQLVLDHPELLSVSTILRRIVPYHLGTIPPDCMPLYKEMLHNESAELRYWACRALLLLTEDVDAVPVAIDLIELGRPGDAASVHPGQITLLQERFAVNYFWDAAAWREWWKEQERKESSESNR